MLVDDRYIVKVMTAGAAQDELASSQLQSRLGCELGLPVDSVTHLSKRYSLVTLALPNECGGQQIELVRG